MSNRFKRVSFALYLDPKQSSADNFAFNTMLGWSKKRQELAADATAAMELHQLVHIHKHIYLSGLYLHTLKPELAMSLASALSTESINTQSLLDMLKLHQIEPQSAAGLGEAMCQTLADKVAASVQAQLSAAAPSDASAMSDGVASVLAQVQRLEETLTSHITPASSAEGEQVQELKRLIVKQSQLIHQLIGSLKQGAVVGQESSNDASAEPVEARLERVQKIRQKGVF
ncbi:hypothetical protein [Vibrio furnissii]|uniref:hypothetical protein n=1 Tax=Vibrio furnissii TaxID=29494 RepID=UPI0025738545|nr:hypothetical protein [Vibrio furnissii]WJG22703.1 hypothetical protein QSU95_05935 [Vibrio furnissii]